MSALTSLLVRDQIVQVRKIEEAIQRQVISGGDIESVLLEMGAVPENVMCAYRAVLTGLLPATRDEVMRAPRETLRVVPREVAERYRLIPLSAEGRVLVVAVAEPLAQEDDEQLSFLLGHDLTYRIVTEVRLWAALAHHYGAEMPAHLRRIADRLRNADAGSVPYVAPPKDAKVPSNSDVPRKWDALDDDDEGEEGRPHTRKFAVPQEPVRREGRGAKSTTPRRKATPVGTSVPIVGVGRVVGVGSTPSEARTAPTRPETPRARSSRPAPALVEPSQPRVRGPVTAGAANALLSEATNRQEVLSAFNAYAKQFFDFLAAFTVQDDMAVGHASEGSGITSEELQRVVVPLDVPGTFADVRRTKAPVVADLTQLDLDRIIVQELGRGPHQPALLLPIVLRERVVMIYYGDRGGERFGISDAPELISLAPRLAAAFERIILKKKFQGYTEAAEEERTELKNTAKSLEIERPKPRPKTSPFIAAVPTQAVPPGPDAQAEVGDPLQVLGVPRSAPPPPGPAFSGWEEPGLGEATRPEGPAARTAAADRPPESTLPNVEPDLPTTLADLSGGFPAPVTAPPMSSEPPELTIEEARDDDPAFELDRLDEPGHEVEELDDGPVRAGGSYRVRDAATEVVRSTRPPRRIDTPPAKRSASPSDPAKQSRWRAQQRSDPRREESGAFQSRDVVKVAADTAEPRGTDADNRRAPPPSPRRSEPAPNEPSVIVDMGDQVESLVDDLEGCGPDDEGAAVEALVHLGEVALPALVQHFPGPLWFDRRRPHRRLPRGRDVSATARALTAFGERAVPYLASLLGSKDGDVRFYAALLCSEMVYLPLLLPLSECIFDEDEGTRLLVLDVLRHFWIFRRDMEEMLKMVRVEAKVTRQDPKRRLTAIRAVGELRDRKALELLIDLLGSTQTDLVTAAHRALVIITRQDFGTSARKWIQWAERSGDHHRIEWLIDALLHPDQPIRAAAADELKTLTQEYFGYHPSSPRKDREHAQRKYREWWDHEGRQRFERAP